MKPLYTLLLSFVLLSTACNKNKDPQKTVGYVSVDSIKLSHDVVYSGALISHIFKIRTD